MLKIGQSSQYIRSTTAGMYVKAEMKFIFSKDLQYFPGYVEAEWCNQNLEASVHALSKIQQARNLWSWITYLAYKG